MTESSNFAELEPVVTPLEGVDEALASIGQRYWKLVGFDSESGTPQWAEDTPSRIDTGGLGSAFVVAAAGVRAVVPSLSCPTCDRPLSLTSRTALARIVAGHKPGSCVDCDDNLQERLKKLRDPVRRDKHRTRQEQAARKHRAAQLQQEWRNRQRVVVQQHHALEWFPEISIPRATVRTELLALAMLRYAPSPAPISPLQEWVEPLHPGSDGDFEALREVRAAGLIRTHPDSTLDSFVWEDPPPFTELAASGDDLPEPGLSGSYFPLRAVHYTPYGESPDAAAATVRDHLSARLNPTSMPPGRQDELLIVVAEVIAEEAMRYLRVMLEEHNLPTVPDNHVDKLAEAAYAAARIRSLGELYNLAWRAARDAAAAAQRNPRAPKSSMTVHAVNRFESLAQQALNPDHNIKPYGPKSSLELAAATRTVFLRILNREPFDTTLPTVADTLPTPASGRDRAPDDVESTATRAGQDHDPMATTPGLWYCDKCGTSIINPTTGIVVWKTDEESRAYDFLVVHKDQHPNQPRKCDPGSEAGYTASTGDLHELLGPDGLARLLGFLALGPIKDDITESNRALYVRNLDQFVDLVHRFHTPHYEQARLNFPDPEIRYRFADANEYAPYVQSSLQDVTQHRRAH